MTEALAALQEVFTTPMAAVWVLLGTALGITVGAIPGLTGAMLIALTLPLTYGMLPAEAMVLLVSMYVGSISGGLITATLLRMPGTPASVITTLDGYPMAQAGRPDRALGLGIMASFIGGMISWGFLLLLARPISRVSTQLGSFDYFALVMVALVLIASVSGKSLAKGIFAGMLGILAKLPGESPATGTSRWTLGIEQLNDGLALLPVLIGLFAVSQILHEVGRGAVSIKSTEFDRSGMGGASTKVLTTFTRQLSILQDAGLPILRSLKILEGQCQGSALKNALIDVCDDIEAGSTLSEAISKQPKVFDRLYVNMIKAGQADQSGVLLGLQDWWKHRWNMLRSSVIGTWVGILPGIGANVGSVIAYSAARGVSKKPEEFGRGSEEGIVASEAANNATIGGALIPLVAMGIPGSVIDAILLGALVLHGLQPGAVLFNNNPTVVYTIIFTMFFANIVMFAMMIGSVRWIARLARTPRHVLLPVIMVFCVVGSYALNNRLFDVWIMLAFGLAGFLLERCKVPLAPFVIGFVLAPIAEKKLGAGLQASNGSWWPLVTEPFSLVCCLVALVLFVYPLWRSTRQPAPNHDA